MATTQSLSVRKSLLLNLHKILCDLLARPPRCFRIKEKNNRRRNPVFFLVCDLSDFRFFIFFFFSFCLLSFFSILSSPFLFPLSSCSLSSFSSFFLFPSSFSFTFFLFFFFPLYFLPFLLLPRSSPFRLVKAIIFFLSFSFLIDRLIKPISLSIA